MPTTTRPRPSEARLLNPIVGVSDLRTAECGTGTPLLLVNGLSRPLESWGPLTEALSGRHLIYFDAPGVGHSPRPAWPLSVSILARLAWQVLDAYGIETADVLGYSFGGAVAQQMALEEPERVRRLILVATTPGMGAPVGNVAALAGMTGELGWPESDAVGVSWRALALATWSSLPRLGRISAPTLVVSGSRDEVVPAAASAMLATLIPNAQAVSLNFGHDLQAVVAAKALGAAVEEFLARSSER